MRPLNPYEWRDPPSRRILLPEFLPSFPIFGRGDEQFCLLVFQLRILVAPVPGVGKRLLRALAVHLLAVLQHRLELLDVICGSSEVLSNDDQILTVYHRLVIVPLNPLCEVLKLTRGDKHMCFVLSFSVKPLGSFMHATTKTGLGAKIASRALSPILNSREALMCIVQLELPCKSTNRIKVDSDTLLKRTDEVNVLRFDASQPNDE